MCKYQRIPLIDQLEDINDEIASALDVAACILENTFFDLPLTTWKLQVLLYYCQVWSLVYRNKSLFKEKIFASIDGPRVEELHERHRDLFFAGMPRYGSAKELSAAQKTIVESVIDSYGNKSHGFLYSLLNSEDPYVNARRLFSEISLADLSKFYSATTIHVASFAPWRDR